MVENNLRLKNNSKIAIIDGDPAGSLFANNAIQYAETLGIHIQITIFESKDYNRLPVDLL